MGSSKLGERGLAIDGSNLWVLAIDPGDVHCGMAWFDYNGICRWAEEQTPADCLATVKGLLESHLLDVLVIEDFQLYPWKAQQQAFSQMLTCRLIGGLHATWGWFGDACELVMQLPADKKPTQAIARARGYKSTAKKMKAGGHAVDAEIHGYRYTQRALDAFAKELQDG